MRRSWPVLAHLAGVQRPPLLLPVLLALVIVARWLMALLPDDVVEGPSEEPHALVHRLLYDRNPAA